MQTCIRCGRKVPGKYRHSHSRLCDDRLNAKPKTTITGIYGDKVVYQYSWYKPLSDKQINKVIDNPYVIFEREA